VRGSDGMSLCTEVESAVTIPNNVYVIILLSDTMIVGFDRHYGNATDLAERPRYEDAVCKHDVEPNIVSPPNRSTSCLI
jgi:hypothetical protein